MSVYSTTDKNRGWLNYKTANQTEFLKFKVPFTEHKHSQPNICVHAGTHSNKATVNSI